MNEEEKIDNSKYNGKEKNNNKLLISIIVLFAIIIILLICFIILPKNNIKNNINTENKNNEVNKLEVSDTDKVQIRKNVMIITKNSGATYSIIKGDLDSWSTSENINTELFRELSISNEHKKYLSLNSSDKLSSINYTENIKKVLGNNFEGYEDVWVVKRDSAEKLYYDLFGDSTTIDSSSYGKCPSYSYESENNVFYGVSRCGGTSAGTVTYYLTNYNKTDSKTITVDIYGVISIPKDITNENFKDLKANPLNINLDPDNFSITEDNKDLFDKYTLTYKLNDNNIFTFNKIEK